MDLKDFYRLILRNLLIVVMTTITGLGAATAITFAMTPIYEAKIQLFVSTPSSALDISALVQGSSFSQQRVKSYAQIINSPEVLDPVIKELGLKTTPQELGKNVKASAPLDTVLIDVSVSNPYPALAARIANAIGAQFSETANNIEVSQSSGLDPIKVSVVKTAYIPDSPTSPKKALNLLLGLILGFGLGIGIAILRLIFDNTVKNESDLDETPLLAVIGFDKEAKSKPLITQISRYASRTEAFRQLRTNLSYTKGPTPPKTIAVTSAMPEEGKTTTSINLALSLATSGYRTVLVEADLRRAKMAKYFGHKKEEAGLSELLSVDRLIDPEVAVNNVIKQVYVDDTESVKVIFGGQVPANPAELLDSENLRILINYLSSNFDYVIIDCPPTLPVADASIIASQVDGVVIVLKTNVTRRVQFLGVRDSINNVGGTILGAVLNMVPESRAYFDYGYKYGYGYGYKGRYGYKGSYAPQGKRRGFFSDMPYAPRPQDEKP